MQQDYKMYINGEWINSSSGKKIETLNPETNEVWATVPEANDEDVDLQYKVHKKLLILHGHSYTLEIEPNICD